MKKFLSNLVLSLFYIMLITPTLVYSRDFNIKIDTPPSVIIGDPFEITIHLTPVKKEFLKLKWLNKKMTIIESNKGKITILLGSDIKKDSPGTKQLIIYYKQHNFTKKIRLKKRKTRTIHISVSKKFSFLNKKTLKKYFEQKKLIDSTLSHITPKIFYSPDFIPPVTPFKITSSYGKIRIINNKKRSIHTGIDIKAKEGTKVRAINSGRVALVLNHFFSGKSIYIDHGRGIFSMYFHLKKIMVHRGEIIKKGEVIGLSGKTGRATGPHLHLGVCILGKLVDPKTFIEKF